MLNEDCWFALSDSLVNTVCLKPLPLQKPQYLKNNTPANFVRKVLIVSIHWFPFHSIFRTPRFCARKSFSFWIQIKVSTKRQAWIESTIRSVRWQDNWMACIQTTCMWSCTEQSSIKTIWFGFYVCCKSCNRMDGSNENRKNLPLKFSAACGVLIPAAYASITPMCTGYMEPKWRKCGSERKREREQN